MSNTYYLVAVDVSGIQDYVFRTNDLQHHLGASELVRQATTTWVRECLPEPHNVDQDMRLDGTKHIENGVIQAEVIYSGGGNAVLLIADEAKAKAFHQTLSLKALLEAPGLTVTIVSRKFVWQPNGTELGAAVSNLIGMTLREKKQLGHTYGEMLGLSVTADCQFTGLPATRFYSRVAGEEPQRISAEIDAKIRFEPKANKRLKDEIGGEDYVLDFDDFGTKGESSYIAVIHADGNKMGKRFEAISKRKQPNRIYISEIRALSQSVNDAAKSALGTTATAVRNMWREGSKLGGIVSVNEGRLPFRPIIFGGDDTTLVCDGRLGLTVAAKYLESFTQQTIQEPQGTTHPTARAGIAIVKTHFPFGQAYALAEDLASSAKKFTNDGKRSAMDWHFGINGVVDDISELRKRGYTSSDAKRSSLLMRPLCLGESTTEWRTWGEYAQLVNALIGDENKYPSNKLNALREALRGGPQSAQRFIAANFVRGKKLPSITGREIDNGWVGEACAYFDAIEGLDFFVPLAPQTGGRS